MRRLYFSDIRKNRKATPFIEEAKASRVIAFKCSKASELVSIKQIKRSMLTATGVSETVINHLTEADRLGAIQDLIDNFLEPSGDSFIDELVYRLLLTRGDALDDSMRNLAGALGDRKFTRAILSTLKL